MSTEFEREERYIVFKLSDVEEHFTPSEKQQLARLAEVQRVGRSEAGKPPLECVVVEKDWPEYEPTWKAIEARVAGAQPAQKAVAYLDLGVGGYMDIGTDLNDEQLASLPKGRHMLGIVGTYGIDGYVSAQPAPSVSDGWKEAAIAWEVCGSLHREYAKGKDPFFKKRQEDFVKHANDARTILAAPEAKP